MTGRDGLGRRGPAGALVLPVLTQEGDAPAAPTLPCLASRARQETDPRGRVPGMLTFPGPFRKYPQGA